MKKIKLACFILISCLFCFTFTLPVLAAQNPPPVVIKATEVFPNDTFKAAEDLVFSGKVNGDLFLAGGMVTFDGETTGDLLVAGGKVIVKGKIGQNLRATGGQVSVDSKIGRNLLVIGGAVELSENASVNGSLLALGGTLDNLAKINLGGNLFAGRLYQNGTFGKKVNLVADQFILGPQAKITGDLTYKTSTELSTEEQKQILGQTQFTQVVKPTLPNGQVFDQNNLQGIARFFKGFFLALRLASLVCSLLLGLVILKLFPAFSQKVLEKLEEKPAKFLGWGILYWLAIPFTFALLVISLVGIPLIPLLIMALGIVHLLAKIFGPLALGHFVLLEVAHQERRGWALVLGILLVFVIGSVPFLGPLSLLLLQATATGTIIQQFYSGLKKKG